MDETYNRWIYRSCGVAGLHRRDGDSEGPAQPGLRNSSAQIRKDRNSDARVNDPYSTDLESPTGWLQMTKLA